MKRFFPFLLQFQPVLSGWLCYVACLLPLGALAQDLNIAFRSKMTFAGQTLANVWGYAADGREYALVGASLGLAIVDITDPDTCIQIVQIPGPNNLWKEIKTYGHYAYVTSEGGQGVQVVDLSGLPSPNLNYHHYKGDGAINNQLNKIHALQVDETKGFLYLFGSNLFGGAPVVCDLKTDPYNPVYVGKFDLLGYVHDGYADNDTLYSSHIGAGNFAIVDMADKSAPQLLATQTTPNAFTHNTWLGTDRRTLLTTDEKANSFLAAYDVSDPENIIFLDKIQSNPGSNSIVHNTYVRDYFAYTSWYTDGITIVDLREPDILVQVGNFDTYPGSGGSFNGCWGVYPYFPSGNVIASNITAQGTNSGELFVLSPALVRACHLRGLVRDAITGFSMNNVSVEILGGAAVKSAISGGTGNYKMGQVESGVFTLRFSKSGYQPLEMPVKLKPGSTAIRDAFLFPEGSLNVSGTVKRHPTQETVGNQAVYAYGASNVYQTTADPSGNFSFTSVQPGYYDFVADSDQPDELAQEYSVLIALDTTIHLELYKQYKKLTYSSQAIPGAILSARPNPFAAQTTLVLPEALPADAVIIVSGLDGRALASIPVPAGTISIPLGADFPAGVYQATLISNAGESDKLLLLKNPTRP